MLSVGLTRLFKIMTTKDNGNKFSFNDIMKMVMVESI